ncbi:hypothetical protein NEUTE1DRAFT_98165 [Neurospora tetrasperma FGSC 2508]|uniref:Conidiation protein con-6 n=1 Tax=Neurospora tetrasperma (strain FGSC 2508 / ATCC MYA-4615 / P0657) TaxID=510951 RepID=F8MAZ3_NEUT8|nr:uncharacterized protein NEUTE1DRAFT_98165 [Neurospora tetrasperma FGSC 2508]EGO61012.1 hypothetical protein NEUTE1DRAFT_98165 [Neurospora tetrasperma FGSC 2508]EGZ74981.1 hypothetical protein NEUTE2DRAFT_57943 [Neurospora tetrasperma FGSC 2509]
MAEPAGQLSSQGAKSAMSNDMKELNEGKEHTSNVIRGHKANLANPRIGIGIHSDTSEESKKHSEKVIEELGGSGTQESLRNNPVNRSSFWHSGPPHRCIKALQVMRHERLAARKRSNIMMDSEKYVMNKLGR